MHSFVLIYAFFPDTFVIIERLKKSVRKINSSIYYLLHEQEVANSLRIGGIASVRYSTADTVKWQLTYSLFWPNAKLSRKNIFPPSRLILKSDKTETSSRFMCGSGNVDRAVSEEHRAYCLGPTKFDLGWSLLEERNRADI